MAKIFFTPGPAVLHPLYTTFVQQAMDMQLGSYSHRSALFRDVYKHTDEQLRKLMNIPATHAILFTGSGSEIWERMLLNCVASHSFHLVNGAFSKKFYDYALALQKKPVAHTVPLGEGFDINKLQIPENIELICATQNETSSGVQIPEQDLISLKQRNPNALICVDLVSTAPYANIDFNYMDAAFFSVQKAFGLPAGLGVWIVNKQCLQKSINLQKNGYNIGAHNTLEKLFQNYEKWETASTPNMMNIFLLGKIAENYNTIGVDTLRRDTQLKATKIYAAMARHENFSPLVKNVLHQSQTVLVMETKIKSSAIINKLSNYNLVIGGGYGAYKEAHIRIANFPSTTMADVELLLQYL